MNKFRQYIIITIGLFLSTIAQGQTLSQLLYTPNQQMVEQTVSPAFSIIRQEFQLQDENSGQKYNLDTLNYFGYADALCVNLNDGIITSKAILKPWEEDKNIALFPDYKPVLSGIYECLPSDNKWVTFNIPSFDSIIEVDNSSMITMRDSLFSHPGLLVDTEYGEKNGWLIWIYRKDNTLSFKSFRQSFTLNENIGDLTLVPPAEDQSPIIGVLVSTHYPEVGVICFKLASYVENTETGWRVFNIASPKGISSGNHTLMPVAETKDNAIEQPEDEQPEKKINRRKR